MGDVLTWLSGSAVDTGCTSEEDGKLPDPELLS